VTDPTDAVRPSDQINAVRRIWSSVLDTEVISLDVNFFDAGGHSLLVMVLQEHLEELAGREISIEDLYQHTTVRAQAKMLTVGHSSDERAELGGHNRRQLLGRNRGGRAADPADRSS